MCNTSAQNALCPPVPPKSFSLLGCVPGQHETRGCGCFHHLHPQTRVGRLLTYRLLGTWLIPWYGILSGISNSIAIRLLVMSTQYFAQRKLQYEPSVENNLDDARACISAGRAASTCPARRTHSDGVVRERGNQWCRILAGGGCRCAWVVVGRCGASVSRVQGPLVCVRGIIFGAALVRPACTARCVWHGRVRDISA